MKRLSRGSSSLDAFLAESSLETKVVLYAARVNLEEESAEAIKQILLERIDWEKLLEVGQRHGVLQLLYHHLSSIASEVIPEPILKKMEDRYQETSRRNAFLATSLVELMDSFGKSQIKALSFKGPVLAVSTYGDMALRRFYDLDILVDRRDFTRATNVLESLGYNLKEQLSFESSYVNRDRVDIDLHHGFMGPQLPFQPTFEDLWHRHESVCLCGRAIPSLSLEDMVLFLCAQIARDSCVGANWLRLGKICDLAEFVKVNPDIDWYKVTQRAHAQQSERLIFFGVLLTSDLMGMVVPKIVEQRMREDLANNTYSVRACRRLLSLTPQSPRLLDSFFKSLMIIPCPPVKFISRSKLFLYFLRWTITPNERDREFLDIPQSTRFLYYLVRPIRLLASAIAKQSTKRR